VLQQASIVPFWNQLDAFGDAPALIDQSGVIHSYRELADAADALTAGLDGKHLVLLGMTTAVEPVVAYLAALRRGWPVIIVNGGDAAAMNRVIEAFEPSLVWHEGEFTARAATPELHPDLAVLLSTSGSTGSAKLVRLSGSAVDANARSIATYLGLDSTERAITTLPLYYSYGLSVLNSHLSVGGSVVLNDLSVTDEAFVKRAEAESATSLAGVPYTYELLEQSRLLPRLPECVCTLTQAGGRMPPERVERLAEFSRETGRRLFIMYGQTEATARMAFLPPDQVADYPDCIGRAIPGGTFSLVDPETGDEAASSGELTYAGPNVMMGYAEAASDLRKGHDLTRLMTGDLAEKAAPDIYRITGRKSRFLKLFGLRISLEDVERHAAAENWALVATGTDDRLVLAGEGELDEQSIRAHFAERYNIPDRSIALITYASLPRLPSGKIDYRTIVGDVAQLASTGGPEASDVLGLFSKYFPGRAVTSADTFSSLGGDSLSFVNFSVDYEERFGALPPEWQNLSIARLSASQGEKRRRLFGAQIESGILLRAFAIAAIVSGHFNLVNYGGGGAYLLLMLAGVGFARFQLPAMIRNQSVASSWVSLARVIVPTVGYLALLQIGLREPEWRTLLLISNLVEAHMAGGLSYWFVEVYVQIFVVLLAAFSLRPLRDAWSRRPWHSALVLFAIAALIHSVVYQFWNTEYLFNRVPHRLLWLVAGGALLVTARSKQQLAFAIAAIVAMSLLSWGFDSPSLVVSLAAAIIAFVPTLQIPKLFVRPLAEVAAASLFIYLSHFQFARIVEKVLGAQSPLLAFALAIVGGIVLARLYFWCEGRFIERVLRGNRTVGQAHG